MNGTISSRQKAKFQGRFEANLTTLSAVYADEGNANALKLDARAFMDVLAAD